MKYICLITILFLSSISLVQAEEPTLIVQIIRNSLTSDKLIMFEEEQVEFICTCEYEVDWYINNDYSGSGKTIDFSTQEPGDYDLKITTNGIEQSYIVTVHPQILINELMLNPTGTDNGNEWIELFNSQNYDLTNWKITDGIKTEIITGNELYLVINLNKLILKNSGNQNIKLLTPDGLEANELTTFETKEGQSISLTEEFLWSSEFEVTKGLPNKIRLIPEISISSITNSTELAWIVGIVTLDETYLKNKIVLQDSTGAVLVEVSKLNGFFISNNQPIKLLINSKNFDSKRSVEATEFVLMDTIDFEIEPISFNEQGEKFRLITLSGQVTRSYTKSFYILVNNKEVRIKTNFEIVNISKGNNISLTGVFINIDKNSVYEIFLTELTSNDYQEITKTKSKKSSSSKHSELKVSSDQTQVEVNLTFPKLSHLNSNIQSGLEYQTHLVMVNILSGVGGLISMALRYWFKIS